MGFDVRVIDGGRAVKGARVVLGFTSIFRGMTRTAYTDASGHASFDGYDDGEVEVFVDGKGCGTHRYRDGGAITISR